MTMATSTPPEGSLLRAPPRWLGARLARVVVGIGTDGPSATALLCADRVARALDASLTIVHVVPSTRAFKPLIPETTEGLAQATPIVRACMGPVRRWVEGLLGHGIPEGALMMGHGPLRETFLEALDELDPDLVVLGPGGLSEHLVRVARLPLFVARQPMRAGRIVAVTDFSDPTFPVLRRAAALGRRFGAGVTLVARAAALEPTSCVQGPREPLLRDLAAELEGAVEVVISHARSRAEAVLAAARDRAAELVVVGTHPRTEPPGRGAESPGEIVAASSSANVLLLPIGARALSL